MYKRLLAIDTKVDGRDLDIPATYFTQFAALLKAMVRTSFTKRTCMCLWGSFLDPLDVKFPWRTRFLYNGLQRTRNKEYISYDNTLVPYFHDCSRKFFWYLTAEVA